MTFSSSSTSSSFCDYQDVDLPPRKSHKLTAAQMVARFRQQPPMSRKERKQAMKSQNYPSQMWYIQHDSDITHEENGISSEQEEEEEEEEDLDSTSMKQNFKFQRERRRRNDWEKNLLDSYHDSSLHGDKTQFSSSSKTKQRQNGFNSTMQTDSSFHHINHFSRTEKGNKSAVAQKQQSSALDAWRNLFKVIPSNQHDDYTIHNNHYFHHYDSYCDETSLHDTVPKQKKKISHNETNNINTDKSSKQMDSNNDHLVHDYIGPQCTPSKKP